MLYKTDQYIQHKKKTDLYNRKPIIVEKYIYPSSLTSNENGQSDEDFTPFEKYLMDKILQIVRKNQTLEGMLNLNFLLILLLRKRAEANERDHFLLHKYFTSNQEPARANQHNNMRISPDPITLQHNKMLSPESLQEINKELLSRFNLGIKIGMEIGAYNQLVEDINILLKKMLESSTSRHIKVGQSSHAYLNVKPLAKPVPLTKR